MNFELKKNVKNKNSWSIAFEVLDEVECELIEVDNKFILCGEEKFETEDV